MVKKRMISIPNYPGCASSESLADLANRIFRRWSFHAHQATAGLLRTLRSVHLTSAFSNTANSGSDASGDDGNSAGNSNAAYNNGGGSKSDGSMVPNSKIAQ